MKRLREIQAYLVDNGGFKKAHIVCHVTESESLPVEQETAAGIHLFDDKYDAVIFVEDVSEKDYGKLRLLLYDWFRDYKLEGEQYRLSSDPISDLSSLVTISLTLVESVHIAPAVGGLIERDADFFEESEEPVPFGI